MLDNNIYIKIKTGRLLIIFAKNFYGGKIMEKQNGEIYATSIEGEGTTFFIKFYKNMI